MASIKISTEHFSFTAELYQPETTRKFIECLPISEKATKWGGKLYFEVPLNIALDKNSQEEVTVGGLAYLPSGKMFCIFFIKHQQASIIFQER